MKTQANDSERSRPGTLAGFWSDREGNIALMFAGCLPVIFGCAALAVDVGSLYTEKRHLQGAVDLAAIEAAAKLDNREAAARGALEANKTGELSSFSVVLGRYTPDPQRSHAERFVEGHEGANAVKVSVTTERPTFFAGAFLGKSVSMKAEAIAATASSATFSIGSRLLAVRGGLPNRVLQGLLGGSVELSAMDYNALLSAQVTLLQQVDALASELNITSGTYQDVLLADASVSDWLSAAAAVAGRNGDTGAQTALRKLIWHTNAERLSIRLDKLISLGSFANVEVGRGNSALGATFNTLELASAAARIANIGNQVSFDIGAGLPGIAKLSIEVAIGEPLQASTWAAAGMPNATIHTAQTRLKAVAEVGGSALLAGANIRLPIYLELASASGRLHSVSCEAGQTNRPTATIAAKPGLLSAWIGEPDPSWTNFGGKPLVAPAQLLTTALIRLKGQAFIQASNKNETLLEFSNADIQNQTVKRTETSNISETVVRSLVRNLSIQAEFGGLAVPLTIQREVAGLLGNAAAPIDEALQPILQTLGVHLGEADVRVHGATCGSGVLAG